MNTFTENNSKAQHMFTYSADSTFWLKRHIIRAVERASGKRKLEQLYAQMLKKLPMSENFWAATMAELHITLDYSAAQLARVPRDGPVIFVANHPFGIVDGFAACLLAGRARGNFRILIQQVIVDVIGDYVGHQLLPIGFRGTEAAARINAQSKQGAQSTLEQGGVLVIFPAGKIQHSPHLFAPPTDTEWKLFTAKLVQATGATVVPFFFRGRNSWLFHTASKISLTLRLGLILREVLNKRGRTIRVEIGDPIPYEQMASFEDRQALTQFLREQTFALAHNS